MFGLVVLSYKTNMWTAKFTAAAYSIVFITSVRKMCDILLYLKSLIWSFLYMQLIMTNGRWKSILKWLHRIGIHKNIKVTCKSGQFIQIWIHWIGGKKFGITKFIYVFKDRQSTFAMVLMIITDVVTFWIMNELMNKSVIHLKRFHMCRYQCIIK